MAEVAQIKTDLEASAARLEALQAELQTLLLAVPNLPHESVPTGADEHGNVELRRWSPSGTEPQALAFTPRDCSVSVWVGRVLRSFSTLWKASL